MLKYLFTGLIIYLVYRYFVGTPALKEPRRDDQLRNRPTDGQQDDYVDYEEID